MRTFEPDEVARVCHEANLALRVILGDTGSNLHWDDLDQETQESATNGVVGILDGNTPEESHESWLAFKEAHGWTYGEVKDDEAKTHPCFVPYAELPPEQQLKDHLFSAVVNTVAGTGPRDFG